MNRIVNRILTGLLLLSPVLTLGVEGCPPPTETCFFAEPAGFSSVEELECGISPDGLNYCHWQLSFSDGAFTWMHSDVGEVGKYVCDGNTATGDTGYALYTGTWDPATSRLTWEGVPYTRTP